MDKNENFSGATLLEQGVIMLVGAIDATTSQMVICQIQYLATKYPGRPIQLWINSPGGEVNSGMAIINVMDYVKVEVQTFVIGLAASMAAVIASSGSRGKRYAFSDSEILIHQPLGGVEGQATDIINAANHIRAVRDRVNKRLAGNTGQAEEKIAADTDRDNVMTAYEAKDYGLIDEVIESVPKAW